MNETSFLFFVLFFYWTNCWLVIQAKKELFVCTTSTHLLYIRSVFYLNKPVPYHNGSV